MEKTQSQALKEALARGDAAVKSGDFRLALSIYSSVAQQVPGAFGAFMGAGYCSFSLSDLPAAHAYYQQAIKLRPRSVEAHHNLAEVLMELRIVDRAEEHYRQALRAEKNFVAAHVGLGKAYQHKGSFEAARREFDRALALDHDNLEALTRLVQITKYGEDDQTTAKLAAIAKADKRLGKDRANAHFALGKVRNDQKRYDEAFEHFHEGRRLLDYHFPRDLHEHYIGQLKEIFSADFFARREGWGANGEKTPVFVLGVPRSGTSLVEQMIASHPKVHGAGELKLLTSVILQMEKGIGGPGLGYPEIVRSMERGQAALAGKRYLDGLANLSKGKPYVVDKMPANYFAIGFIKMVMPGAKIIHCVRSLYDIAVSLYSTNFQEEHAFLEGLSSIGFYLRQYAGLMHHWDAVLPGFVHHVVYEDLVSHPEPHLRSMLDFLELEWDEKCLDFHHQKRPVMTASAWQVRQPLYKSSTRRWKNYEKHLGPLLEELPHESWRDYADNQES